MIADAKKPVTEVDDDQIHNLKVDTMSHNIINQIREELKAKGMRNRSTSVIIRELYTEAVLSRSLCKKLIEFAGEHGENEGATDVLDRLLHELTKLRVKARHGLDISNIGFNDKHELIDVRVKAHKP